MGALVLVFAALAAPAPERAAKNASCAGCHPQIAAEWQESLHKQAWVDPVFQQAYQVEPLAFCRGCHAPESDAARPPSARAQQVGVGCTTCHEQAGEVHGTRPSPNALHAVVADARLGTQAACAACHQFDFPAPAHQVAPEPMQDTLAEHEASPRRDQPCQSCHMPAVDGPEGRHRSHRFSVIADPALLRRAVKVEAARTPGGLRLALSANEVGHAFPTGDMFRRLEVRAETVDGKERARPVVLARVFADVPRDPAGGELTFQRVQIEDSRVPPVGERVVTLALASGARARWSVVYQRMSTPMADAFGVSQVLDEVVVAQGEMP